MKKLMLMVISFIIISSISYGEVFPLASSADFSSEDLYDYAKELVASYPEVLSLEVLGHSYDGRPIYVIRLAKEGKYHVYFEAGMHGRETANPNLLLALVEAYAKDTVDEETLPFSVGTLLEEASLHFIVLSNPDSYDLAKFGVEEIRDELYREEILAFNNYEAKYYKANVRGVDLNRNFPATYYDEEEETWIDLREAPTYRPINYQSAHAYYGGEKALSEVESQLIADYALKYDFRNYTSFHNRGQVIYYYKFFMSQTYLQKNLALARLLGQETGYHLMAPEDSDEAGGFFGDYIAMETGKPSITIETVPYNAATPIDQYYINHAYDHIIKVPYLMAEAGIEAGYGPYRLYVNGRYLRDYDSERLALTKAEELGGFVVQGSNQPIEIAVWLENKATRQAAASLLWPFVKEEGLDAGYLDSHHPGVLSLASSGVVDRSDYFYPHRLITEAEYIVMLSRLFYPGAAEDESSFSPGLPPWAMRHYQVIAKKVGINLSSPEEILTIRNLYEYLYGLGRAGAW